MFVGVSNYIHATHEAFVAVLPLLEQWQKDNMLCLDRRVFHAG
jgi:hypothetical protein